MISETSAVAAGTPTRARYWVIVFAVTLAILAYIDRVCFSVTAPDIRRDLDLSHVQMGYVFSTFALAYTIFQIPGGWMGDWLGPKRVLIRIVLWWSFFTAATGWAWSLASLWVIRLLFGAGQAGCFPNLTKAFTTWLPAAERVRAQGIMWAFTRWGGAFSYRRLSRFIFDKLMHWRRAFEFFGALGLIWCWFFSRWYKDNPRDHPSVNAAELALLADAEKTASGHGDVPWGKLIASRTVWLLWLQYFFLAYPWYFYITWLPTYLQEFRGLDPESSSRAAIFPLVFGGFGSLFCGLISARVARWMGSVATARRFLAMLGFFGAGVLILVSIHIKDPYLAMIVMELASFFNDLAMPVSWGACMDVGGKYAGTLSGSMNMMGNMAGFVAPPVAGYILRYTGDWNLVLYVMAGVHFLGTLCWPFIDPVTPLEKDGERRRDLKH